MEFEFTYPNKDRLNTTHRIQEPKIGATKRCMAKFLAHVTWLESELTRLRSCEAGHAKKVIARPPKDISRKINSLEQQRKAVLETVKSQEQYLRDALC